MPNNWKKLECPNHYFKNHLQNFHIRIKLDTTNLFSTQNVTRIYPKKSQNTIQKELHLQFPKHTGPRMRRSLMKRTVHSTGWKNTIKCYPLNYSKYHTPNQSTFHWLKPEKSTKVKFTVRLAIAIH